MGASLLVVGSAFATSAPAQAADAVGFAVVDCNLDGDQFMLADGKAELKDWTVDAVDANGAVVKSLTAVDSGIERFPYLYRSFTVPEGTVYDNVHIKNTKTGAESNVKPVAEPCDPTETKLVTGDPGPGLVSTPAQRVLDTRIPTVAVTGGSNSAVGQVPAGGVVEVKVAGVAGIPTDANAVLLNVAAVQPQAVGHVRAYPCGSLRPLTSNLNFIDGETRAANVFVKPGVGGKVCLYTSALTHLIADTQGYVAAKSEPVAIKPIRVADTRVGAAVDGPGLLPRKKVEGPVRLDMSGLTTFSDVPADATGYIVNITTTNATNAGHGIINLCRTTLRPAAVSSAINFIPGRATANMAYASYGDELCLNTSQPVDLIVDVTGYTTSEYGSPQLFAENLRLLETRPDSAGGKGTMDGKHAGIGRLKAGTEYRLDVAGRKGSWGAEIPTDLSAVVLNITGVRPDSNGHVTAYECGKKPQTSNLNIRKGEATANVSLVPVGADGKVCLYTNVATDLVVDISGFVSTKTTPVTVDPIMIDQARPEAMLNVVGGQAPYTLSGDLPTPVKLAMDANGLVTYSGDANTFAHYVGTLAFMDANGNPFEVEIVIAWYPESADVDSGVVI